MFISGQYSTSKGVTEGEMIRLGVNLTGGCST